MSLITRIISKVAISACVYFGIALSLTLFPVTLDEVDESLNFDVIKITNLDVASNEWFTARDGKALFYRLFPSTSKRVIVLLHGSGSEGRYLAGIAGRLSRSGIASVVVPDLRGHGESMLTAPGDVSHLGQLEEDLEDLYQHLVAKYTPTSLVLGGHSSGGALAIKHASQGGYKQYDGLLLFAPYLGHDAVTTKPNSGEWVQVITRRFVGLSMLNNLGITLLNDTPVLFFNRPEKWNDALQLKHYSYRMTQSFSPGDYETYLQRNERPILVLIGSDDEALYGERYPQTFAKLAPQTVTYLLDGVEHLNVTDSDESYQRVVEWMKQF